MNRLDLGKLKYKYKHKYKHKYKQKYKHKYKHKHKPFTEAFRLVLSILVNQIYVYERPERIKQSEVLLWTITGWILLVGKGVYGCSGSVVEYSPHI